MKPMMLAALGALAAGACAGIFLASRHFLRKRLPVWVAALHGVGGAVGFTLVLLVVVQQPAFQLARQALYLLIATVALGSVNLLFHVRGIRHRTSLILLHALTAVSAVSTLIYALVTGASGAAVPAPPAPPVASAASPIAAAPAAPSQAAPTAASATARPEAAPGAEQAAASPPAPGAELAMNDELRRVLARPLNFAPKSGDILEESQAAIREMAAALVQHPEVTLVQVQGHADARGADLSNIELTQRRAAAVVNALVQQGVQRDRLHGAGFGARCPVDPLCREASAPASCQTPEQWQADRRVVLVPLRIGNASFSGELACPGGAALIPTADRSFHRSSR
jgi:outer membrane protein OmpA-like peptidoglycan-associated protein